MHNVKCDYFVIKLNKCHLDDANRPLMQFCAFNELYLTRRLDATQTANQVHLERFYFRADHFSFQ